MTGLFITIEGIDGSGKTTQINLLKKYIENKGFNVIFVREPGGNKISERIRKIILDVNNKEMDNIAEVLLYASSRAQLVSQVIKPELKKGSIVICDRFVDSSVAYQGFGRKIDINIIKKINNIATRHLSPDITFFLDLDPKRSIERKKEQKKLDRMENEKQYFYNSVYHGYLELAKKEPERIKVIDATQNVEEIHMDMTNHLEDLINKGIYIK